jgi:hypothetical protein
LEHPDVRPDMPADRLAQSSSQSELHPQLADIKHQLANCSQRAQSVVYGLTPEQLRQRPASGWSIAECLAHLTLTTGEYLKLADRAFIDAPRGPGKFKRDLVGRILAWTLEPPYRMKVKTLPAYIPGADHLSDPLAAFFASQQQLIATLYRANGIRLDRVKVQSSFNPRIYYNLLSFFSILAAHQRRHLWQAEQVKKQIA